MALRLEDWSLNLEACLRDAVGGFFQGPRGVGGVRMIDQRADELAVAVGRDGYVLAGCGRDDAAVRVAGLGGGPDQLGTCGLDVRLDVERLTDAAAGAEADAHFATDAEPPAGPGGGPDHRLVEDRPEHAAMHDALKADVIRPRRKRDADD